MNIPEQQVELFRELRSENIRLTDWIRAAAPLLQIAACIAADAHRLAEVPGIRAVVEDCPIDFMANNEFRDGAPDSQTKT